MHLRALGSALLLSSLIASCGRGEAVVAVERAPLAITDEHEAPSSVLEQVPSTTTVAVPATVAPTTTAPTTTTTAPGPVVAQSARPAGRAPWTLAPYFGLGAWLDAFDWSTSFARSPEHVVGVEAIDHMAAEGVQTLFIQASRWNSETDVIEPERIQVLIDRAHAHGISVVAWYLPTLVDPDADLRRLLAIAALDVEGVGVDIESREVTDVAERNRRLIELSHRLDEALGGRPLAAIPLEPVVMEDVNPDYWPGYPWMELAQVYDVWLPMSYWTNRRGEWRSAHTYVGTNMARLRERIGQPDALVHPIGGIGDETTVDDLQGMLAAAVEQRAIGGSIYDYRTTRPEHWELLRGFRSS